MSYRTMHLKKDEVLVMYHEADDPIQFERAILDTEDCEMMIRRMLSSAQYIISKYTRDEFTLLVDYNDGVSSVTFIYNDSLSTLTVYAQFQTLRNIFSETFYVRDEIDKVDEHVSLLIQLLNAQRNEHEDVDFNEAFFQHIT